MKSIIEYINESKESKFEKRSKEILSKWGLTSELQDKVINAVPESYPLWDMDSIENWGDSSDKVIKTILFSAIELTDLGLSDAAYDLLEKKIKKEI